MKKNVIRLLMSLVAILTANTMLAENKLWIASEGNGKFAIMMDCDQNAAGLQFNLQVPDALDVIEVTSEGREQYVYRNPERFANGQQLRCSKLNDGKEFLVMVVSMNMEPFIGENGTPVAYFQTVKNSATASWENSDLKLTDIIFSTGNGNQLPAAEESVYDGAVYGELRAYFDMENLVVNPGQSVKVPVALKNTFLVSALQMNVQLPAGFTFSAVPFEHTSRVATTAQIRLTDLGSNYYSLIMSDIIDNKSIPNISENGDVIFYCNLEVAENFDANGKMTLSNAGASTYEGNFINGVGTSTLSIVNGNDALVKANEDVQALKDALAAALAIIANDYPEVKDQFTGDEISASIATLEQNIQAAYDDLTLTPNYDAVVTTPANAIKAEIDQLVVEAQIASEAARIAANKAAYEADLAKVEELMAAYRATVAEIQKDYKDFEDVSAENAVRNDIEAAKAEVEKAYKAVATEGKYVSPLNAEALQASIDKLLADAKQAKVEKDEADKKAEEERVNYNKTAYEAALASLAEIQKNMDATVAQIKADYADYEDAAAEAAVQGKIDAAKAAAEAAFKAVEKEGKFAYTVDAAGLNADIKALLDAAIAAKKAAEDEAEAKRQANNLKLYNADKEAIAKVMADYIATVKEIQTNYKDYEDAKAEELVKMEIETAEKNIENAYRAVTNEGDYKSPVDFAALNASVAKLLQDAKDAKVKAEEEAAAAEQKRQDDNKAAYEADLAKVADLMAKYRAVVDEIQNNYADYEDSKAEFAVLDEINAAKAAVEEAYKAVEKAGNYATPVDFAALEASIDKLLADAQQKKADEEKAEADRQERNKAAYESDLAAIETLTANLEAAVALIQKDYAEFEDAEAEKAVADAIAAAKAEVEAAYALVEKEGEYKSPLDAEALQAAIDKLVADAKAGQAAKDAEAERQARNLAQYNIVIGQISELKAELTAACLKIDTDFNGWNYSEAAAEIQKALDEAREGADAAYAAVEKEGEFDFTFDADAIRAMIAKMVEDAELGVDSIEAEAGEAIYFTLDGKRHERPVQGEVNVIVRKNGKTEKVMVK